jgi:hypothetical protein
MAFRDLQPVDRIALKKLADWADDPDFDEVRDNRFVCPKCQSRVPLYMASDTKNICAACELKIHLHCICPIGWERQMGDGVCPLVCGECESECDLCVSECYEEWFEKRERRINRNKAEDEVKAHEDKFGGHNPDEGEEPDEILTQPHHIPPLEDDFSDLDETEYVPILLRFISHLKPCVRCDTGDSQEDQEDQQAQDAC